MPSHTLVTREPLTKQMSPQKIFPDRIFENFEFCFLPFACGFYEQMMDTAVDEHIDFKQLKTTVVSLFTFEIMLMRYISEL